MQTYPGKRALELLGAASACIAFTPVAVCIALAIWLENAARLCTGNHAAAFAVNLLRKSTVRRWLQHRRAHTQPDSYSPLPRQGRPRD